MLAKSARSWSRIGSREKGPQYRYSIMRVLYRFNEDGERVMRCADCTCVVVRGLGKKIVVWEAWGHCNFP
jgi:hypothetical protein